MKIKMEKDGLVCEFPKRNLAKLKERGWKEYKAPEKKKSENEKKK